LEDFLLIVSFFMIPCFFALMATLIISRNAVLRISQFNYRWISILVIWFLFSIIFIFSGVKGFAISILATSIGIFASLSGVKKSHCMGVLMIPTLVYYLL